MKTVQLKIVPLTVNGETGELNYKAQLEAILKTPSNLQGGADYDEIRKSIRLLDILETANGEVKLEDADHEYLKARVMGARYGVIDKVVQSFIEDVIQAK